MLWNSVQSYTCELVPLYQILITFTTCFFIRRLVPHYLSASILISTNDMIFVVHVKLFKTMCTVDAVRRNPQSAQATDKDVAEAAKVWLKHAKDRLGGRAAWQRNGPRLAP